MDVCVILFLRFPWFHKCYSPILIFATSVFISVAAKFKTEFHANPASLLGKLLLLRWRQFVDFGFLEELAHVLSKEHSAERFRFAGQLVHLVCLASLVYILHFLLSFASWFGHVFGAGSCPHLTCITGSARPVALDFRLSTTQRRKHVKCSKVGECKIHVLDMLDMLASYIGGVRAASLGKQPLPGSTRLYQALAEWSMRWAPLRCSPRNEGPPSKKNQAAFFTLQKLELEIVSKGCWIEPNMPNIDK